MEIEHKLLELGLSQTEVDKLGISDATVYYKFYHNKSYGISSVLFSAMDSNQLSKLKKIATSSGLKVNTRISIGLTFFCHSNEKQDRLEKAKSNGTILLSPDEFIHLFSMQDYSLRNLELLFDTSIQEEFRIPKPLSNFNIDKSIDSFSFGSEEKYTINLHLQTCSCPNFIKSNKENYKIGDIRRFCKHLMNEYASSFGISGLSAIQKGLFKNGYPIKKHLDLIKLESLEHPVYINRDNLNEWWNLYVCTKNEYDKYAYDPKEERFSYNDKPHGYVKELREQLKFYDNKLSSAYKASTGQGSGCAAILFILLLVGTLYLFLN